MTSVKYQIGEIQRLVDVRDRDFFFMVSPGRNNLNENSPDGENLNGGKRMNNDIESVFKRRSKF